jgi:D-xylose transport system substrate-binding protein
MTTLHRRLLLAAAATSLGVAMAAGPALAQNRPVVGVSWANFQEERYKTDEAAIKAALERMGADYVGADAQSNAAKQLADIEGMLARGVSAIIVNAWDADAIVPAVARAQAEGVPVIGYDRPIAAANVFNVTFDNREVGRMQARAVLAAKPTGAYVFIKGAQTDPNAAVFAQGQRDVLDPVIQRGDIRVVGDEFTERWLPANAQRNMEQILTRANNRVDAVVASNDGTAGGVIAALQAQGLSGIPVSGQDADQAALNRIARGQQLMTVWKDVRDLGKAAAEIALQLGRNTPQTQVQGATTLTGPNGVTTNALLLKPVAVDASNLQAVIEAGWARKEAVCQGVSGANAPAACR